MKTWLRPIEGATKTVLSWDGQTLTATDEGAGIAIRVKPAALSRYYYVQDYPDKPKQVIGGLVALDADGLVILDLPGGWDLGPTTAFAAAAGLPLTHLHHDTPGETRAALAARAPGWRRLHGRGWPFLRRWRALVAICAGVVGLGVMVYLAVSGAWMAWRGLAFVGRIALDLLDAKWLMIAFSPALLVLRPVMARLQRRRTRTGALLAQAGGAHMTVQNGRLRIERGKEEIRKLRIGPRRSEASSFLLYRYTPAPLVPPSSAPSTPTAESTAQPITPAPLVSPSSAPSTPTAESAAQPITPDLGAPSFAEPGPVLSPAAVEDGSGPPAAAASVPSAVGLFVLNATGLPLLHLPGPWDAGMVERFTQRNHLRLAVHKVSREEYLQLVRTCRDAAP